MIELRDLQPDDLAEVSALGIRSKASWGYGADEMEIFSGELTLDDSSLAECPTAKVAIRDEQIVGHYTLRRHANAGVELEHMFVDPDHFRHGIGRQLFASALETARAAGAEELMLISDPNAGGFYENQGARITGEHHYSIPGRTIPIMTIGLRTQG